MARSAVLMSDALVTTPLDESGGMPDEECVAKESAEKAPFLEVKIPQPGEKELPKMAAAEFAAIGKRLKSYRVKP